jgi:hypothetical protein
MDLPDVASLLPNQSLSLLWLSTSLCYTSSSPTAMLPYFRYEPVCSTLQKPRGSEGKLGESITIATTKVYGDRRVETGYKIFAAVELLDREDENNLWVLLALEQVI